MDVMAVAHRFLAVDDGGSCPGVVADAGRTGWTVVVFNESVDVGAAVDGRGVSFSNGVFLVLLLPLDDDFVVIGVETGAVVVAAVDNRGVSFPNGFVPDEIGGVDRSCTAVGSRCCCCWGTWESNARGGRGGGSPSFFVVAFIIRPFSVVEAMAESSSNGLLFMV